jgi:hypothetical protein
MHEMKEGHAVEHREDVKREPQMSPEPRREEEQPKLKRFHIVKLEERIAPLAGDGGGRSHPSYILSCI